MPDCTSSNDKQDAVLIADAAQTVQKLFRRGNVAALTLHRFDDDSGDLIGRRGRVE
jgi:hypothetical protein